MTDVAELTRQVQLIDGWLFPKEVEFLYQAARACQGRGAIVEIGSWKGKSTVCLAKGSQDGGHNVRVVAIDPHVGSPEHHEGGPVWTFDAFTKNITVAGVASMVKPLVMTSEQAAREFREPVEMLFIDGAHDYDSVKLDFDVWYPKVMDGGVIAFHDVRSWVGPRRVFQDSLCRSGNFQGVGLCESIGFGRKGRATPDDVRHAQYMLRLTYVYDMGQSIADIRWLQPLINIGKKVMGALS